LAEASTRKQAAVAADAGGRDGPSPLEPNFALETKAGREAAVVGSEGGAEAKTADTATADSTTAAAAGVQGGPDPPKSPSSQPKHDFVRGAGHEPMAGGDEEQQREAQLQDETQQREAKQLEE
jgi:hypothetical protein